MVFLCLFICLYCWYESFLLYLFCIMLTISTCLLCIGFIFKLCFFLLHYIFSIAFFFGMMKKGKKVSYFPIVNACNVLI